MSGTKVKEVRCYVYAHKKADDGEVFYVGKGSHRIRDAGVKKYERAFLKYNRTKFWKNVVQKHGYVVEILHDDITEEEAFNLEIEYIGKYGCRLQGGLLVNLTEGGEGPVGSKHSEDTRRKMSEARKGNPSYVRTEEWCRRQSERLKGKPGKNKGQKRTEEQRKRISEAHKGLPGNRTGSTPSEETVKKIALSKIEANSKRNVSVGDRGKTGNLLGVTLVKGRYLAQIKHLGKHPRLGSYDTEMEAHLAYVSYFNQFVKYQEEV